MKKFNLSLQNAIKGIWKVIAGENNMRIHLIFACLSILSGFYFHISTQEWLWTSIAIAMVISAEIFNTAIEKLTDIVSPEYNPQAGLVKDMAAGAVLVVSIGASVIGLIIFIPKVM